MGNKWLKRYKYNVNKVDTLPVAVMYVQHLNPSSNDNDNIIYYISRQFIDRLGIVKYKIFSTKHRSRILGVL